MNTANIPPNPSVSSIELWSSPPPGPAVGASDGVTVDTSAASTWGAGRVAAPQQLRGEMLASTEGDRSVDVAMALLIWSSASCAVTPSSGEKGADTLTMAGTDDRLADHTTAASEEEERRTQLPSQKHWSSGRESSSQVDEVSRELMKSTGKVSTSTLSNTNCTAIVNTMLVGASEGEAVGGTEGWKEGERVGRREVVTIVGERVGERVGRVEGERVGEVVGEREGLTVGRVDGLSVGERDGEAEGRREGTAVGEREGDSEG